MVSAGYSQNVAWGNETTYGSTATINKDLGIVQSISPGEKSNLMKLRTLGGNRDYKTVIPGKFEISGSMEYYLQGGAFLRQAWGEDTGTTATVDSGPKIIATTTYKHIMGSADSPGVNSFPSFTLEFTDYEDSGATSATANLKRTYTGCRVDNLTISGTVDEPVKVSVDWMSKKVSLGTGAATSITEYATDPFIFYEGAVFLTSGAVTSDTTQATLKADDSDVCQVLSFDFGIANNVEAGWYISGTCSTRDSVRGAKYIIPKGRDYSLSLGLHYKNKEMYQRFLGSMTATTDQKDPDKFQVVLDMVKTGTVGDADEGDHYLRIIAASALFDDAGINGAPEDIVNNDVTVFMKSAKAFFVDNVSSYE